MSVISLDEYAHDIREKVRANAEAGEAFVESAFTEQIASELTETGVIEGFDPCHYRPQGGGMRVDGYWFRDSEVELDLFITDFDNRDELISLTQTDVNQIFKRAENFFLNSADNRNFYANLEETSEVYGLARQISERAAELSTINIFLISERVLSERVRSLEEKTRGNWTFTYSIWDISRLHRQYTSTGSREALEIDFSNMPGGGLPCLSAHLDSDTYRSYLVVIPGGVLANIYGKYGSRLLEQNVRSFLQVRGNVNKGIRATVLNEPEMFFAYNNGITATARDVVVTNAHGRDVISSAIDLQIVNGGQTTATLFHTFRKDKASLDRIFVQMKLSIIDAEKSETVVPRISEYANTQNKVSAADFFSNHPYHIRMEEFSRRIWAPARKGAQRETKWFYERARGQYADAVSRGTQAEQKRYQAQFPKDQMFTKTDMAKFENVWDASPVDVNMGSQKNFARYAQRIGLAWSNNDTQFNELHYRRLVARAIVFRKTERIVSEQDWYNGGYRANVVAYTIAIMAKMSLRAGRRFDFERVWKTQDISSATAKAIAIIARYVYKDILMSDKGVSNISEWCKRPACWFRLQGIISVIEDELPYEFFDELTSRDDADDNARQAARTQKVYNGIQAQTVVVNVPAEEWIRILNAGQKLRLFDQKELGILQVACQIPEKIPTDKQCEVLIRVLDKARLEGIYTPD